MQRLSIRTNRACGRNGINPLFMLQKWSSSCLTSFWTEYWNCFVIFQEKNLLRVARNDTYKCPDVRMENAAASSWYGLFRVEYRQRICEVIGKLYGFIVVFVWDLCNPSSDTYSILSHHYSSEETEKYLQFSYIKVTRFQMLHQKKMTKIYWNLLKLSSTEYFLVQMPQK